MRACLLPKLRHNFAEFLHPSSLKRLRIFSSPTRVGLQYGPCYLKLRGFSWELGISYFAPKRDSSSRLGIVLPDLPKNTSYSLKPGQPTPGQPSLLRHPIAVTNGAGILTCFPSTTALALVLGADSPCADARGAGNLGLTARELFTPFIATHVSIRTSDTSSNAYASPSQAYGTLSYQCKHSEEHLHPAASVYSLSPVTSSAQDDSTSELLRFL